MAGYMTVMLDASDVAGALKDGAKARYDAADLDLGWACSKDTGRAQLMASEHGPGESRATNGHVAIRVPNADPADAGRTSRLDAKTGKAVVKLAKGAGGDVHDGVRLSGHGGFVTADNAEGASVACREPDYGAIPDWSEITPKGEPVAALRLSAGYLKAIASYFAKHGPHGANQNGIELRFYDETSAVVIVGEVDGGLGGREAEVLLMPLRF